MLAEWIPAYTASLRAAELGYQGDERFEYIIKEVGLPKRTLDRKIQKLGWEWNRTWHFESLPKNAEIAKTSSGD